MNFINEKNRLFLLKVTELFSLFDNLTHILYTGIDGAETEKRPVQLFRNDMGKGRFTYARRTPQDHGWYVILLDRVAQYRVFAYNVLLSHIVINRIRAHAFCKWNPCCHHF